ncbi:hypothetical protein HBB16_21905 [Pseudonocardia sp. MCCB 268]|nr:hypothetical protein [Pseudonocardia cytotoxica]
MSRTGVRFRDREMAGSSPTFRAPVHWGRGLRGSCRRRGSDVPGIASPRPPPDKPAVIMGGSARPSPTLSWEAGSARLANHLRAAGLQRATSSRSCRRTPRASTRCTGPRSGRASPPR